MIDEYTIFETIKKIREKSNYNGGTPVGAALLSGEAIVFGWNRYPDNIDYEHINKLPRKRIRKHFAVHAEIDALLNASSSGIKTSGGVMYITRYPCVNCISSMIIAGIREIHFLDEKNIEESEIGEWIFKFSSCNIRFFECKIENRKIYKRELFHDKTPKGI